LLEKPWAKIGKKMDLYGKISLIMVIFVEIWIKAGQNLAGMKKKLYLCKRKITTTDIY